MPKASAVVQCFFECHASQVFDQYRRPLWLFHPNTEYWKNWLQERWQADPFTGGTRTPGSMALFDAPGEDIRFHATFAKSMVSERLEHVPLPGKGYKAVWNVIDRGNNHFLDAAGYACAAAASLGVRLVAPEVVVKPVKQVIREAAPKPHNRFRQRTGGWVQGAKRRQQ